MEPKPSPVTKEQLDGLFTFWQRRLRLMDWNINLTWVKHSDGWTGQTFFTKYKAAMVKLVEPDFVGECNSGEPNDQEITLVHEFLHIQAGCAIRDHFHPADRQHLDDDLETFIDLTAQTLVGLRRELEKAQQNGLELAKKVLAL